MPVPTPEAPGAVFLILTALPVELRAVRRTLRGVVSLEAGVAEALAGTLPSRPDVRIVAVAMGMGRTAASREARRLLEELVPVGVLVVGFGGGCDPTLHPGALVAPATWRCEPEALESGAGVPAGRPLPGREPIAATPSFLGAATEAAREARRPATQGVGVSVAVVAKPSAKASLFRYKDAAVCDMETYFVGRACVERGIPWIGVRAVFDGVEDDIPNIPPDRPVRALVRRPWLLARVPGLVRRMLRAQAALAALLPPLLPRLVEVALRADAAPRSAAAPTARG